MNLAVEQIDPLESKIIDQLVRDNLKTSWSREGIGMRGQHAKHHGCVEGRFEVVDPLPDGLGHGVFEPGRGYDCQVRFSNGAQQDDREKDVRGMAIKLMDVDGTKLLPGQGASREQDFILVDHPVYFTATMKDYVAFNRHFTPVLDLRVNGFSIGRGLRAAVGLVSLLLFHRATMKAARKFAGRCVSNPLALSYHSTTPFLLGPNLAVKYKAVGMAEDTGPTDSENGLRTALWKAISGESAKFDFGVVLQEDASAHPIEDPSVDWEKNGAKFVRIAELTLKAQDNSAEKDDLAARLKFNPWMSLSAHRPIGGINRARRQIYDAMSRLRKKGFGQ